MLYILCFARSLIISVEELNNSALSCMIYDIHVLNVVFKQVVNKSGVIFFNTRIFFSSEHSIMLAYKHLTLQFGLLELVTHQVYAPLHSTLHSIPPRPKGEYT